MFLLSILPKIESHNTEAFIDSFLLSVLISPALYFFIYTPLKTENQEQELQESTAALQDYSQNLELKVYDRTQELETKNLQLQSLLEQLQTAQIQMIQSEKMSSLGKMVAGVAHEINNPVTFIHGNLCHINEYIQHLMNLVDLYQRHSKQPIAEIDSVLQSMDFQFLQEDLPKLMSSMTVGTNRIREIVLSLRNFSRLNEEGFKAVNLHDGLASTLLSLSHRLQSTPDHPEIIVTQDYDDLPLVECYPGSLNQVLMNILTNAIDAIEERKPEFTTQEQFANPGHIKISTSKIDPQFIQISIADNGNGMPADVRNKVFDPFFTTKPIGKGTGMGMAISYKLIAEKHGGRLDCISRIGHGTEFRIQLPIKQAI
jgi:signal transduction histidine kinase